MGGERECGVVVRVRRRPRQRSDAEAQTALRMPLVALLHPLPAQHSLTSSPPAHARPTLITKSLRESLPPPLAASVALSC